MKEIKDIIEAYDLNADKHQPVALATVINVKGSSYRRPGARMLVQHDGVWTGGISGGCLEGDALKKTQLAIAKQQSNMVTYDTSKVDEHQIGVGLGCKGVIDVLISPINDRNEHNPIKVLRSCSDDRDVKILLTIAKVDRTQNDQYIGNMIKFDAHTARPDYISTDDWQKLIKDIEQAKSDKISTTKAYDSCSIFIEILPPPIRLILFGGNYDVIPLLELGQVLGWQMEVVGNPRRLNKQAHQMSHAIHSNDEDLQVDAYTAFVLMTHDYKADKQYLKNALTTNVPYIGMLGPRVRGLETLEELQAEGVSWRASDAERFYNPIGLDTGADNPDDIAISIIAEVRSHFNNRSGGFLRERVAPIYNRN
jgi:xanthine dehydrogenase accessory factor